MLDWETLGTSPDSVCLSLGAVFFDRDGIHDKELFVLNAPDQRKHGRTENEATKIWWSKQSLDAQKQLKASEVGGDSIQRFLENFEEFIDLSLAGYKQRRDTLCPWGNGANFDIPLLEDFYRRHHKGGQDAIPWKFWNVWCYRTFSNLTKCRDLVPRRHGTYHNALDDSIHQVNTVLAFWNKGKK
jgi:hypothetical protein